MMESTRNSWSMAFKEALEYDAWGQVEEAVSCYRRLQVATALEGTENKLGLLQAQRRAAIVQLAAALKLRIQELSSSSTALAPGLGLTGMQALKPFVAGIIVSDVQLPQSVAVALKAADGRSSASGGAQLAGSLQQLRLQPGGQGKHQEPQQEGSEDLITTTIEQQDSTELTPAARAAGRQSQGPAGNQQPEPDSTSGTLRPALKDLQPGDVTLSISFGSWSVKGADRMAQPHVLLTARDKQGKLLEAVQQSPQVCASRSGAVDKLDLDFVWHLQTPLNCLPEDAAVFMELQHYKADKKKTSVRCYCLLAYDELLRPGAAMLGLYKKPADYKRRGQHPAYTSKPMYLHIIRTLSRH